MNIPNKTSSTNATRPSLVIAPGPDGKPRAEISGSPQYASPSADSAGVVNQPIQTEFALHTRRPRTDGKTAAQLKATAAWQMAQWKLWPTPADWPHFLDVYEAAAFLRISPDYIRGLTVRDSGKVRKAKLAHKRLGSHLRIAKADLDEYGNVAKRVD